MTYHLLSFSLKLLSSIPFRVLYVLSDALYYVVYYIVRYRRAIVHKNLTESFPEKSEEEITRIEKQFYHFFTDQVLESCKMATISPCLTAKSTRFSACTRPSPTAYSLQTPVISIKRSTLAHLP